MKTRAALTPTNPESRARHDDWIASPRQLLKSGNFIGQAQLEQNNCGLVVLDEYTKITIEMNDRSVLFTTHLGCATLLHLPTASRAPDTVCSVLLVNLIAEYKGMQ